MADGLSRQQCAMTYDVLLSYHHIVFKETDSNGNNGEANNSNERRKKKPTTVFRRSVRCCSAYSYQIRILFWQNIENTFHLRPNCNWHEKVRNTCGCMAWC